MDMGEYGLFDSFGQILEFEVPHRLVRSYIYNVPVIREAVSTETATFTESDGITTVEIVIRHLTKENRDGHAASGIEYGAGKSYDALEEYLHRAKTLVDLGGPSFGPPPPEPLPPGIQVRSY